VVLYSTLKVNSPITSHPSELHSKHRHPRNHRRDFKRPPVSRVLHDCFLSRMSRTGAHHRHRARHLRPKGPLLQGLQSTARIGAGSTQGSARRQEAKAETEEQDGLGSRRCRHPTAWGTSRPDWYHESEIFTRIVLQPGPFIDTTSARYHLLRGEAFRRF
jgi:hypothetical protein